MRLGVAFVLLVLLILISGCTQTGRVVEKNLTPEEELVLEELINKTLEARGINDTGATGNASQPAVYMGPTEPQNITQPLGCPETCDDKDYCTYDYCSQDTGYGCVHAARICPNFVEACPDGVEVVCENACINNSCTRCKPDCSEHQLPACETTQEDCGPCQILDTENCECARIISCVNNDECCPEGCNYTNDNDCEVPEGECSLDLECNDGNNCTTDTCEGIPKACLHENVTACISGDGCCPSECNYTSDTDCEEPPEAKGDYLIINEIMYNPSTGQCSDSYCEWIELYNPNNNGINVSGWTLCNSALLGGYVSHSDGETYMDSDAIVPAKGYAIITDGGSGTDVYEKFNVNFSSMAFHVNASGMCGNNLVNTEDTITLTHSNGTALESVTYSNSWGGNGNNKTLERYGNNEWKESITDSGTPGSKNSLL